MLTQTGTDRHYFSSDFPTTMNMLHLRCLATSGTDMRSFFTRDAGLSCQRYPFLGLITSDMSSTAVNEEAGRESDGVENGERLQRKVVNEESLNM